MLIRSGLGKALLATILLCFGCSSTDSGTGSPGAAGQSAGGGGHGGGADAAQSGGAGESAGDGGDSAGSAGDGNDPGTSNGGTGQAGVSSTGGTSNSGGSGGHETGGSPATGGGSGSDECVWEPLSTDHCHVCDGDSGCARPGYKYMGSGAITASCCGLEWQEETAPGKYTWSEAVDYCASLALLGSGWRLPKVAELYSLVDLSDESHSSPTINVGAFADTLREAYWSSSPGGNGAQAAWSVNFSDGASQSTDIDQPHRVRCVR